MPTWREEDPATRKILEFGTTFRLVYMQKFGQSGYHMEKEKKKNGRPLAADVQECTRMRFMNCMIDITRCPLTILTKTHIILSNMKSYENDKEVCFI